MKNYYEILGVPENAEEKEIKKVYRRLAKEWHPDRHQGKDSLPDAEAKFKEISEAYSILSDPRRRQEYDYTRAGPGAFKFHGDPFSFFTGSGPFGFGMRQNGPIQSPGHTVQIRQDVPLHQILFGGEQKIEYNVKSFCSGCNGQGANEFKTCPACNGRGVVSQSFGTDEFKTIWTTCHACGGLTQIPDKKCQKCLGNKHLIEQRSVTVKIPPKIAPNSRLRLRGAGGNGTKGMPPGDLVLEINIQYPDLTKLTEEEQRSLQNLLMKA